MKSLICASAALVALSAVPSFAQGLEGGEMGLDLMRNTSDGFSQYNLGASGDLSLGALTLQGDLGWNRDTQTGSTHALVPGLHVAYGLGGTNAAGAFLSYESITNSRDVLNYGIEGSFDINALQGVNVQPYFMRADERSSHFGFNTLGVDTKVNVTQNGALSAGFATTTGAVEVTKLSVGAEYGLGNGMGLGISADKIHQDGGPTDTVIGLNLSYSFGQGATFNRRSLADYLPGF